MDQRNRPEKDVVFLLKLQLRNEERRYERLQEKIGTDYFNQDEADDVEDAIEELKRRINALSPPQKLPTQSSKA